MFGFRTFGFTLSQLGHARRGSKVAGRHERDREPIDVLGLGFRMFGFRTLGFRV